MNLLLRLLVLVALLGCFISAEQEIGENNLLDHPPEEKSRFKKFLNLFGIGSGKQFQQNEHQIPEFNPYRYPCAISMTTTTPAPVVLSPLLCPFPPMMPPQFNPPLEGGQYPPVPLPRPGGIDQYPQGPPPHLGEHESQGPHPSFPGFYPHLSLPTGQQPPILIPIQPGQNPPFPFPGQNNPNQPGQNPPFPFPGQNNPNQPFPLPGQNNPNQPPIQNLPNPVQPGQVPNIPGHLLPNPSQPGQVPNIPVHLLPNPNQQNPEHPIPVDPLNPENPEKVNPVVTNPYDPIKVNPTISDPTKPIFVDPVDIRPSQPLLVDPATVQPGKPLFINPLNPPPSLTVDSLPPPPPLNDPKAFSKYPGGYPFGPADVLINPGFPDPPPQPSTVRPNIEPSGSHPKERPSFPTNPFVRPTNVLINPGLPLDPPAPNFSNSHPPNKNFNNPGLPPNFLPPNAGNVHYIPLSPNQGFPNRPPFPGKPFLPILPSPFSNDNNTLSPPPSNGNISLPPPPPLNDFPPGGSTPIAQPPQFDSNNINPSSVLPSPPVNNYPGNSYPPNSFPVNPNLLLPEHSRPPCGTPFLKPYVPPGFHLSSVNQFIGVSPVPNVRFNFPCPTLDLLQTLDFKIMRSLIVSSGLAPLFDQTRNYTLFLPSDAAFRRLPRWFRDSLEVDNKLKKALLLNHLVKEDLPLSVLENEELILSARPGGNRLRVNIYQTENTYRTITVDGAEVEKGDILTSNGRIHIVNKVLMPNLPRNAAQYLSEKLEFESFWNMIKQADMISTFQDSRPFTLFIPVNCKLNDTAFLSDSSKTTNVVKYHVVNGTYYSNGLIHNEFLLTNYEKEIKVQVTSDNYSKSLTGINGRVRVLKADITLTNGVAHVIDQCISEEIPFYVYPQSDEFKNEFGVLRRSFRVTGEEKNIENAF